MKQERSLSRAAALYCQLFDPFNYLVLGIFEVKVDFIFEIIDPKILITAFLQYVH